MNIPLHFLHLSLAALAAVAAVQGHPPSSTLHRRAAFTNDSSKFSG